jgi:hypothetical protein
LSIPLVVNGQTFEYPVNFDENWGVQATGWAQAVTNGLLQRAGGSFPLLADVNFGASFGLLSAYFETRVTNPASSGLIRLSKTDTIDWRNNANSADLPLGINGLDQLTYNGVVIGSAGGVTSLTGTANQITVSASTGSVTLSTPQAIGTTSSVTFGQIIDSGLTASELVVTDGSKQLASLASPTLTEIGYVAGATSSLQTQISSNASQITTKAPSANPTFTGTVTVPNGSGVTDAAAFGQLKYFQAVQTVSTTSFSSASSTFTAVTGQVVVITPSIATHRVKITVNTPVAPGTDNLQLQIGRNGAGVSGPIWNHSGDSLNHTAAFTLIDSPNTTSAITYQVYARNNNNTSTIVVGRTDVVAVIIAEEIV